MTTLKACPFCGSDDVKYDDTIDCVSCRNCDAEIAVYPDQSAVEAWNRRAPSPELQAARKALEKIVAKQQETCAGKTTQAAFAEVLCIAGDALSPAPSEERWATK